MSTHEACVCGHGRSTHGDIIGATECSRQNCRCVGWRSATRVCSTCGTSWDADGPEVCPEADGHPVAAIIRQAIHNSHDKTYRFPQDVEEHVASVTRLIVREAEEQCDALRAQVERVRALAVQLSGPSGTFAQAVVAMQIRDALEDRA